MEERDRQQLPIFVYGTLRPGCRNYPLVVRYVHRHEPAWLSPFVLYDLGEFPGMLPDLDETGIVRGDLLYIKPDGWYDCLFILDRLESNGFLFMRNRLLAVTYKDDETVMAWSYIANPFVLELAADRKIASNDWLNR